MDRNELLNDNQETFRQSFKGAQTKIWTSLPAIVVSVDFERQTISAQSAISGQITNSDGSISPVDMPIFHDVVLCFPRAGGYAITFPVQPGDEVLIMFASRCIDEWWQSGGENNIPPESRIHDLSDSFAILAPTSQPKAIANISPDTLRIMSENSNRYIEINNTEINIHSQQDINLNATRDITLTAGRDLVINADRNITTSTSIGDISINSGSMLSLISAVDTHIDSGVDVIVDADRDVHIGSGRNMDIEAAIRIDITAPDIYLNGIVHP